MFDVFIMEKITGSGFACFMICSNDQADGEIRTPDLLITNENHINCVELSLKDLGRENPLKSVCSVAHFIFDVVLVCATSSTKV